MKKTKSLIAMILLIVLTVPMIIQVSQMQTAADLNVPVYLKVHAEPNPVGLGQTEFISLFFTKPIPNVAGADTLHWIDC